MFEGFPKDLPDFLWGLALHNEKSWFEAHREDYERTLRVPFTALAKDVAARAEELWPGKLPGLHLSRIHRDARRLFGRGPYKDHLWFTLGLSGKLYSPYPRFWFEIGPASYSYGMGWFESGAEGMALWREAIDENPAALEKIVRRLNRGRRFTRIGPLYKRPKGRADGLLADWYNAREGLGMEREVFFEPDPPGAGLVEEMLAGYQELMPLYDYMCAVSARLPVRGDGREEETL